MTDGTFFFVINEVAKPQPKVEDQAKKVLEEKPLVVESKVPDKGSCLQELRKHLFFGHFSPFHPHPHLINLYLSMSVGLLYCVVNMTFSFDVSVVLYVLFH